jgi:hypothetical protein
MIYTKTGPKIQYKNKQGTQTQKDPTAKKKFIDEREKNPNLKKKPHREMPDQS